MNTTVTAARSSAPRMRRRITRCREPLAPTRRISAEVARAADRLGYEGVLTPTGTWCEDAWLTASALLAETERLKFLVAFRLVCAADAGGAAGRDLQRFSGKGLLLNMVTGGDDVEQRRFGDWLDHDERYARTGVPAHRARCGVGIRWTSRASSTPSRTPEPRRRIRCRRSTSAARRLPRWPIAAEHVDVYLTWGEPPLSRGRQDRAGTPSPTNAAARCASESGCTRSAATPPRRRGRSPTAAGGSTRAVVRRQTELRRAESEGQRRMMALHGGRAISWRSTPTCGRASGWCAAGRDRAGRQPRGSSQPDLGVPLGRVRRVHPVGLPAPGRGVLVRRGRATAAPSDPRPNFGSAAELLADVGRRRHLLQATERDDAGIAEPGGRLVGIVDAVQPGRIGRGSGSHRTRSPGRTAIPDPYRW